MNIYEWLYSKKEQKHIAVLLVHVQLGTTIEHCVFEAGMPASVNSLSFFMSCRKIENPNGVTLFYSDGKYLYKNNATMLSCLMASKHDAPSETVVQNPTTFLDRFLTYTDHDK